MKSFNLVVGSVARLIGVNTFSRSYKPGPAASTRPCPVPVILPLADVPSMTQDEPRILTVEEAARLVG